MTFNSPKTEIIRNYFEAFNKQEIKKLSELFTDDVTLKDWIVDISGKTNVIRTIKDIFKQNKLLKINVINIARDKNNFYAEIDIIVNENEKLEVIDLIKIREDKISSLKAFKCN